MADGRGEADEREIIKPPLRSSVWKHFGFCKDGDVPNKSLAVCRICKGQVKYNSNTTNLSNHLLRRHRIWLHFIFDINIVLFLC
ncbi:E3 SUMO-protein ligase ZBED1-like isoform X2 [Scomber scombrus]|uniref:E3 SUMO-protein ligase ZBED1-like isoform X2 n=1 Tax=Scomber scombrus TaxID=13677 RepID=A0AAV1QCN6_SCOSC